jgi:hypothetical protein
VRRADHWPRGILRSVVRLSVIPTHGRRGLVPIGLSSRGDKTASFRVTGASMSQTTAGSAWLVCCTGLQRVKRGKGKVVPLQA